MDCHSRTRHYNRWSRSVPCSYEAYVLSGRHCPRVTFSVYSSRPEHYFKPCSGGPAHAGEDMREIFQRSSSQTSRRSNPSATMKARQMTMTTTNHDCHGSILSPVRCALAKGRATAHITFPRERDPERFRFPSRSPTNNGPLQSVLVVVRSIGARFFLAVETTKRKHATAEAGRACASLHGSDSSETVSST